MTDKNKNSKFQHVMNLLSLLSVLATAFLAIQAYQSLPERIPIHFDASGEANGFGHKMMLFLLPGISLLIWIQMTFLLGRPHVFNYAVPINEDNVDAQHQLAIQFIHVLRLILSLLFFMLTYFNIQAAHQDSQALGIWLLPLILLMVFIPLIVYIWKSKKLG